MKDKISFNTIDTSTTGVKTVTYTGVDSAGNKSEVQLQVEVTFSGERIVNTGLSKKGCPYVWGSTGPNSFDCSGFTQWVYRQNGIYIPRTSSEQKAAAKKVVSLSELEVGDILWRSGHVGIYIGNGKVIHSANRKVGMVISAVGSPCAARRILTAENLKLKSKKEVETKKAKKKKETKHKSKDKTKEEQTTKAQPETKNPETETKNTESETTKEIETTIEENSSEI